MKLQQNASSANTPIEGAASSRRLLKRLAIASSLVGTSLLNASAQADLILLGSDYFETIQPTSFMPLDFLGFGVLNPLKGAPIGPGTTDTIVQRQADCSLTLSSAGSNCTIPIELVALSLVSTVNASVIVRESPTLASSGSMTITSDGSGVGGTFNSFFDIFFELSLDGGINFLPLSDQLISSNTRWTTIESGMLVDGLMGDPSANRHTDKGSCSTPQCVDFYVVDFVTETIPNKGIHTARPVSEPASTLGLVGFALAALGWVRRRSLARG